MDIASHLGDINWLAVLVATIAAFAVGAIWYAKPVFGGKWMQEIGLTEEAAAQGNMPMVFGTTFVLQFIAATALDLFLGPQANFWIGLHAGFLIGLIWIATAYAITYLFEQRTMRLFFINAGYYVVLYSIMGSILGAWN